MWTYRGVLAIGLSLITVSTARSEARQANTVRVKDAAGLRQAAAVAKPGTHILLEPGDYIGGAFLSNVAGTSDKPIVIGAADRANPPRFTGSGGLHLSDVAHVVLRDLVISKSSGNGLNIDDGGTYETPSHHVTLQRLRVSDLPRGNNDGIKLSGLDDFRVENCTVERWGGSAIDMVGCHRGVISGSTFRDGGDNAVQCKGGTSEITVRGCRFENFGERGVNLGGSTGLAFFRPPVDRMDANARYEARNLRVEGCTFAGGMAPVAFVGVDGAKVRFNTIYHPGKWAIRILQETGSPDFIPSRNGVFEDNLVVFRASNWGEGGVNIGPGTEPRTFRFARNFWYCSDSPQRSRSTLPTPETGGVYGQDPLLRNPESGDFGVKPGSPAKSVGSHALPR